MNICKTPIRKKPPSLVALFKNQGRWAKFNYFAYSNNKSCPCWNSSWDIPKGTCAMCLDGALHAVYGNGREYTMAKARVRNAIRKFHTDFEFFEFEVWDFNDDKYTTIADIRRVCKEAKV